MATEPAVSTIHNFWRTHTHTHTHTHTRNELLIDSLIDWLCDYEQVWPYLLGHYPFGSTEEEREAQDSAVQAAYEATMSEWLAVEAIIRQRDKEMTAARIAKLSSGSQSGEHAPEMSLRDQGRSLSNEVLFLFHPIESPC